MSTSAILILCGIAASVTFGLIGIACVALGAISDRRRNGGRRE